MKVFAVHQAQVDPCLQLGCYAAEFTRALDHSPAFNCSLLRRGQTMLASETSPNRGGSPGAAGVQRPGGPSALKRIFLDLLFGRASHTREHKPG